MKRHFQRLSLGLIAKRGFSIISALLLCVGLISPLRVNAEDVNANQPALKISWIYFRSNTQTNNLGGNTTDQAWLIYNFEFDKPYTGTMRSILSYTCGFGYVPYMMVDGVYYTVQTTVTNDGTTSTTRQNTFDFVLTNTKSFKIIVTVANTYLNYGGITTPSMDLSAYDGSVGSGVDYTNILTDVLGYVENIDLTLTDILDQIEDIAATNAGMAQTLLNIQSDLEENLYDVKMMMVSKDLTKPQRDALYVLIRHGGQIVFPEDFTSEQKRLSFPFVVDLSNYTNNYITNTTDIYFPKGGVFYYVFYTPTNQNGKNMLLRISNRDFSFAISNPSGYITKYYSYALINPGTSSSVSASLVFENPPAWVYPIFFGQENMMDESTSQIVFKSDSQYNLITQIRDLLGINNQQNDEMIDQLDDINHDTSTISQQIDNLNTDFNNALSDVPINETLQEINNLNSAFQTVNGWWAQLWNALGVVKIVIILAMILMLIRIFLGRSR